MRVKMNYHGSIPFNVPTASSKQPGGRFFDRCASQFWATACASPAARVRERAFATTQPESACSRRFAARQRGQRATACYAVHFY